MMTLTVASNSPMTAMRKKVDVLWAAPTDGQYDKEHSGEKSI